ncbi:hypothetical protein AX766_02635 [Flavobacterium covae]|uniref:Glycosyl transferase family 1 domain-containing protein n=1 Tax=Flavobacterium covae TaxID=2906076 RepID=A0ABW8PDX1_9FLAO|nr:MULTISPECIES: hypothetical protein [Flavobacterium]OXA82916.1 hypothetical protein B0A56_03425 [Flavobacterium columnare NBRC 100251 = ATCC 23463]AND63396.1 hypothetical protein AX766_02635 [Flavobacterium covae]MCJ1805849.1 hypothetical protein [Flavobacterium covae]OWP81758.1 hypothetical protein BWK63_04250 [Flavobacterium covae]POR23688.1 hypothetical protein BWK57_01315 [Flavobacterium columnare]
MKKNIAFIEMETHSALLEQWYLLVAEMPRIDFHFYVSQKVYDKLTAIPEQHLTIIHSILKTDFSIYDAVVVNTIHRNYDDYKTLFEEKAVLCLVHNINFSLFFKTISWKNIFKEKEKLTYFLKLYWKEKVASKRKVITKAKKLGVISSSALETVKKQGVFLDKIEFIQMNYCKQFEFPEGKIIQIVMPGNVSNKRKDIDMVFRVIQKLKPQTKLHFTFLGKPENKIILKQLEILKKSSHSNISITHYHQFIPWEEYSQVISKAHLLLCPIKQATSFYWVDEKYGETKVSGAEADCIYNGKIALFPENYPKMDWENLLYKNEEELLGILENLTIEKLYLAYHKLEKKVPQYNKESVVQGLEEILLNLQ